MTRRAFAVGARWLAVLAVLGAGCTGSGQLAGWQTRGVEVHSVVAPSARAQSAPELLARLASMTPAEARVELAAAWDAYAESGQARDRLWVLLLTVRAQAGVEEDRRALRLLEGPPPTAKEVPSSESQGLDAMVHFVLAERVQAAAAQAQAVVEVEKLRAEVRSLDASLGADRTRIKEVESLLQAERRRSETLARQLREAERRSAEAAALLEGEQRENEALQGKIEQLKTIERIIDRREEPRGGAAQ